MGAAGQRSSWVSAGLAAALAASLVAHVLRGDGAPARTGPRVTALRQEGPARRPTLLVDFDAPMVASADVGRALPDGHVRLDPPAATHARYLTPRRLAVTVQRRLPLFQDVRLAFGPGFADAEGRAVAGAGALGFTTGRLALDEAPRARFDDDGRPICGLSFNGPVTGAALREKLVATDGAGRDLPFTLRGKDDAWRLRFEAVPPAGSTVRLKAGLCSRLGPAGLEEDVVRAVTWSSALRIVDVDVTGTHPRRSIELSFSHPLAGGDVAAMIDVEPRPADLAVRARGATVTLTGAFRPRRTVRVLARSGLAARGPLRLAADVTRSVFVPPPASRVRIAQEGRTLSTRARPELSIEGINVPKVEVTLREVFANNVVPLALRWEYARGLSGPKLTKTIAIDAAPDETWTRTIDLAGVLGRAPRGIFHVTVRDPENDWRESTRLLQVTDLAPVMRVAGDTLVVFVSRLSDGAPVAGARVEAFDEKNQPCGSGTTDDDGLCVTKHAPSTPFVVTVTTGDDRAWVDLRTHAVAHAAGDIEGRASPSGLEAYVYADRGVVRPGETARLGVLVRTPDGGAAPAGLPLSLAVRAPDRRIVKRLRRKTNEHGMLALDLPFALDAPTGPYVLEVGGPGGEAPIGRTAFRVDAVVPDRIEPALTLPAGDLAPGSTVSVGLSARLLAGDPAGGRKARLRVRYAPVLGAGDGGHAFGDRFAAPAPFAGPETECRLDDAGLATAQVTLPGAGDAGVALRATFELEVVDVSGRAAFARRVAHVMPAGPRLGLGRPGAEALDFDVVLRGGERAAGRAVLQRVRVVGRWVREGRRTVWRGEEEPEVVAEAPLRVEAGRGRVRFGDPGDGRFRVRVEAEGAAPAAVAFERWGGTTYGASEPGAPRLALSLAGARAEAGGTARIAVEAPVAGRALLTLESTTLHAARVIELAAGAQGIDVTLPAIAAPSVHATLTLVRGAREAGERPARLLGAVAIPLTRAGRDLGVSVDAPQRAAPGTTVEVRVRTAAPATVRVHLVDEGVLRLTGHPTPDPHARLEAVRRLDTRLADVYTSLLAHMRFGGDDPEPGGGEAGARNLAARLDPTARKTIETVALASALVSCDGEARVPFRLPDYEGRLRVFVVAAGKSGSGSAAAPLVVRGAISLALHVPRAVAPGDEFEVPVVVRGDDVDWSLSLDGLERVEGAPGVRLRAGEAPGVATVTLSASDARGNRARRVARIAIRPAAPYAVRHVVRRVAAGQALDEALPGRWLAGHATARITVGDVAGLEALPALERLLAYPHGCVEQTSARAFSVLAWSELMRAVDPEGRAPEDTVGAAIDRLLAMQAPDGGLATWPGGTTAYPFGSAFAAHFLVEARRHGRAVPAEPLKALLDYLDARMRRGAGSAYGARVLALAGRAVGPYLERLAEEATGTEERANLAAAFLLAGKARRAAAVLGEAGDPWRVPRQQGGRLESPVRAAATLLGALVAVSPEDGRIPDLVARLEAELRAHPGTTQDEAATVLALASYHAQRARGPESRGTLVVGGVEHPYDASGLHLDVDPIATPRLALRADGPTTVVVRVAGVPLEPEPGDVERGMRVTRRIEAPAGALKQGEVYRVVIEGTAPRGAENVLVTDVLPGGLEIEDARGQEGTLDPDRVEPRDDRVLFFRTAPLRDGRFRQTYLVRAVTRGRFRVPAVSAELLYAPEIHARSGAGATLDVVR